MPGAVFDTRAMTVTVSTFYKFTTIAEAAKLTAEVAALGCSLGIRGSILIAGEGINATVSGSGDSIARLLTWLRSDTQIGDFESNESVAQSHPFRRLKVKVKPEIVTFGRPDILPLAGAGTYVRPENWNALIAEPDVVVVDTRNSYETCIGTFPGALDPKTETFGAFAAFADVALDPQRHRKVAMFCTGGIRCEKATAYLRSKGFEDVYHLQGGILKYLEVVPQSESLWQGECFVFDDRSALGHTRRAGRFALCPVCGWNVRFERAVNSQALLDADSTPKLVGPTRCLNCATLILG